MQELKAAERRLGEAAYRRSGEQSGPAGLVEPIWKLQNQLENLECEVSELGRSKPGAVITPWRLAAVAATVMLIATGWLLLGLRRSASQSAVGQPSSASRRPLMGSPKRLMTSLKRRPR